MRSLALLALLIALPVEALAATCQSYGDGYRTLTASRRNVTNIPARLHGQRSRTAVKVGAANACAADIRFHSPTTDFFLELFQRGSGRETYGAKNGIGPVARFYRRNGQVYAENRYNNERSIRIKNLGPVPEGDWRRYGIRGDFLNPGWIEYLVDNRVVWRVQGDVQLGPGNDATPDCKIQQYGDGIPEGSKMDFDNVSVGNVSCDGAAPPPSGGGESPTPTDPPVTAEPRAPRPEGHPRDPSPGTRSPNLPKPPQLPEVPGGVTNPLPPITPNLPPAPSGASGSP